MLGVPDHLSCQAWPMLCAVMPRPFLPPPAQLSQRGLYSPALCSARAGDLELMPRPPCSIPKRSSPS